MCWPKVIHFSQIRSQKAPIERRFSDEESKRLGRWFEYNFTTVFSVWICNFCFIVSRTRDVASWCTWHKTIYRLWSIELSLSAKWCGVPSILLGYTFIHRKIISHYLIINYSERFWGKKYIIAFIFPFNYISLKQLYRRFWLFCWYSILP